MTDAGTLRITAAVAEAASVPDALDDLIQRSTTDPGAPLAPDVVAALADLQRKDPRAFEKLRAQLKEVGVRVTVLDKAIADAGGETSGRQPKQTDTLIELASRAELFHTADGTGYARPRRHRAS